MQNLEKKLPTVRNSLFQKLYFYSILWHEYISGHNIDTCDSFPLAPNASAFFKNELIIFNIDVLFNYFLRIIQF